MSHKTLVKLPGNYWVNPDHIQYVSVNAYDVVCDDTIVIVSMISGRDICIDKAHIKPESEWITESTTHRLTQEMEDEALEMVVKIINRESVEDAADSSQHPKRGQLIKKVDRRYHGGRGA